MGTRAFSVYLFPLLKGRLPQPYTNTLNLETGKASRVNLLPQPPTEGLDFPQLRRSLLGRKNRFGYFTGFGWDSYPNSLVKLDLNVSVATSSGYEGWKMGESGTAGRILFSFEEEGGGDGKRRLKSSSGFDDGYAFDNGSLVLLFPNIYIETTPLGTTSFCVLYCYLYKNIS